MFKYDDNGKQSQPREAQRKVVTAIRKVTYLNNHPDPKVLEPLVTEGYETVIEANVSLNIQSINPDVIGSKTVDNRKVEVKRKPFDMLKEKQDDRN